MTDRVRLCTLPTPVEPAPRLAAAIGLAPGALWIKRDDLVGLGGGGNKVRKLERLCADALAAGATTLVTTGAAQSNHARLTAAAGARLGLDVELVLAGTADSPVAGNLVLDHLFGARLHWAGPVPHEGLEAVAAERVSALADEGVIAARIPYGGTNASAATAYADAGREAAAQVANTRHHVVAVGSGGTMAGLVAGLGADLVLGVDTGAVADPHERVSALVRELGSDPAGLRLRTDQVGSGYSDVTPSVRNALRTAATQDGLVLDPIYTGRAMAGLVAAIADGDIHPDETVMFWHTGGLPGLFGSPAAVDWIASL
ncbi:pyridoxal-phosphate dependent enzyme [Aeromicrobium sp. CF3.5]|uniref:pyridoxal-phosphate dependent enzyme n=1 Tax=Aeromicrobium sp. CF3.5 TaxID=3373078 RepID=UPI003EE7A47B